MACPAMYQQQRRWLDARRFNELYQFDVSQPTAEAIAASVYRVSQVPLPAQPYDYLDCRGLQLAPDSTLWAGNLYVRLPTEPNSSQRRTNHAAVVRHPDVLGAGCGLDAEGYAYRPGQNGSVWLPNVITNMLYALPALHYATLCGEDSVRFWASSAGDPAGLRWDFGDPGSGPGNTARGRQAAHRYAQGGNYTVRLTLADGRVLSQVVEVPAQAGDFTGQNVFTPNGDGLNDAFLPLQQPLPGARLQVFSRWGQEVFRSDDASQLRWDGTGAAAGEYFYQLNYASCRGKPQHRRGVITLIR